MSVLKKITNKVCFWKKNKKNLLKQDKLQQISFDKGLKKSNHFFKEMINKIVYEKVKIDESFFQKIEETLLVMDLGVNATNKIMSSIIDEVKQQNIADAKLIKQIIIDKLFVYYIQDTTTNFALNLKQNEVNVILFFGVNGVGKTTTIAKVANYLNQKQYKVCLIAGDTFRAGAVEQLDIWAKKLNIKIFKPHKINQDPASVIYDGIKWAKENNFNVVLCDTSGRMQNKINLMNELKKIDHVIKKFIPNQPCESLLVIDSTIGQSGLIQAKIFLEFIKITGIILTKIDSTSHGGIVFSIKDNFNLPVKFVGLGETINDLQPFDLEKFIYSMVNGIIEE